LISNQTSDNLGEFFLGFFIISGIVWPVENLGLRCSIFCRYTRGHAVFKIRFPRSLYKLEIKLAHLKEEMIDSFLVFSFLLVRKVIINWKGKKKTKKKKRKKDTHTRKRESRPPSVVVVVIVSFSPKVLYIFPGRNFLLPSRNAMHWVAFFFSSSFNSDGL
jgi:hypothetical protein